MYRRSSITGLVLVVAILCTASVRAATYKLDPAHSFIVFQVGHLGVSKAWGMAPSPSGTVVIDDADATRSSVQVEVKTEGIITGVVARDNHIKGPDFFDARQFPTISFKSTSVKKTADNTYEVTGDFSLHGVTKPLTLTLTRLGERDTGQPFGVRAGFETVFTIKRSDFGMAGMLDIAQDDVKLFVNLEGGKENVPLSAGDILIPLAVSLAVLLLARLPWPAAARAPAWSIPLAISAGWIAAFRGINGTWPGLPPNSAIGWVFHVAIAAVVIAAADALIEPVRIVRWIATPLILACAYSVMLRGPLSDGQTRGEAGVWIVAFALVSTLWIRMLRIETRGRCARDAAAAMSILALMTAVIWVMSYTWLYARLAIALSAAVAPAAVFSFVLKPPARQNGAAVFAVILGGTLLCGRYYSAISPLSLILIGLAPLLFGLGTQFASRFSPAKASLISLSLLVLPLLIAIGLIAPKYVRSLDEPTGMYGY